jgi:hypothetical protein
VRFLKKPALFLAVALLAATYVAAKPNKPAPNPATVIDKGSFGIFVSGRRVATEDFTISQTAQGSVAESALKLEDGKPAQECKLQLAPDGNLLRYEWKVVGGQDKSSSVIEPENEFLIQHIVMPDLKTADRHFLLTTATSIVDDYFFSHREILLWRYLGGNCKAEAGKPGCTLVPAQLGVITPRQQSSALVNLSYVGLDNVLYKGTQTEMSHFKISTENSEWHLWLDDGNKLVKIAIPADSTEVIRD